MAESEEPRRFPTGPPGSPLPRIWKADPEPVVDEDEPPTKKKKKKKQDADADPSASPAGSEKPKKTRKAAKSNGSASKGKLVEETPRLETYEGRRAARMIAGGVILGVLGLAGIIIFRFVGADRTPVPEAVDQAPIVQKPQVDPQQAEREARSLFDDARAVADRGDAEIAITMLKRVRDTYPKTNVAREARAALERPKKNLPLFVDRPAVVASNAETPPRPEPTSGEPPKIVEATEASPPAAAGREASLVPPANPAEPPMPTKVELPTPAPKASTPARPLPAGYQPREGTPIHSSGWPTEIVGDRDGAPMVLIPAGTFTMGRDDSEANEGPAHKVSLSAYYIDQHEVTVRQFNLFQKESGRRSERARALARAENRLPESEDSPVVMVTANEADAYAKWAGKQLPTEAQWEMAARGPDGRIYPWGNDPPQWDKPRKPRQIDPIRSYTLDVSPFGVHDMAGNAWEWTRDWYDPRYYHLFRDMPATNPTGPSNRPKSHQLTVRGGSKNWAAAKRDGFKPETRMEFLGSRCVLPLDNVANPNLPPGSPVPAPNQAAPDAGKNVIPPF
jgi:formylglycine-generating enzyme required for sulfatase activity